MHQHIYQVFKILSKIPNTYTKYQAAAGPAPPGLGRAWVSRTWVMWIIFLQTKFQPWRGSYFSSIQLPLSTSFFFVARVPNPGYLSSVSQECSSPPGYLSQRT